MDLFSWGVKAPTDLFGHGQALRVGDGSQLLLLQFLNGVLIISQIKLGSHQDDGSVWTVVSHFWIPLNTQDIFNFSPACTGLNMTFLRSKALIISARLVLPCTSGNKVLTFARTFSKEAGLTREKQMRNTSYGKKAFVMYQWRYTDVFPLFLKSIRQSVKLTPFICKCL